MNNTIITVTGDDPQEVLVECEERISHIVSKYNPRVWSHKVRKLSCPVTLNASQKGYRKYPYVAVELTSTRGIYHEFVSYLIFMEVKVDDEESTNVSRKSRNS
nr:MAG TPA_asm: hypothetical protein [Picobirnaviridae sp.]